MDSSMYGVFACGALPEGSNPASKCHPGDSLTLTCTTYVFLPTVRNPKSTLSQGSFQLWRQLLLISLSLMKWDKQVLELENLSVTLAWPFTDSGSAFPKEGST